MLWPAEISARRASCGRRGRAEAVQRRVLRGHLARRRDAPALRSPFLLPRDKYEFLMPVVGEASKREGNGMRRMRLHIHARPVIALRASWHQYLTMLAQSPWQAS